MKTMLKKNLVRNGFLGHGLLLLIPNVTAVKGEPLRSFHEARTPQSWMAADTSAVPMSVDSSGLLFTSESDMAGAPGISLNTAASVFVKRFLKREDEALSKVKKRSAASFKTIEAVFSKQGLPLELKYLAVVESDLKTTAVSKVGAKGMWQLMPTTAREMGLKVSGKYDERIYAYKSTVAAAKYLKSLYADFGDWLLVVAAYNSGPGTVYKAIKKSGTRNFWALQNFLPAESRAHVKRFIGTHYYFEGEGSLVTMTKAETSRYNKAMAEFKDSLKPRSEEKDTVTIVAFGNK
jgi:membrane-bound lytic murein transglycosylase D